MYVPDYRDKHPALPYFNHSYFWGSWVKKETPGFDLEDFDAFEHRNDYRHHLNLKAFIP